MYLKQQIEQHEIDFSHGSELFTSGIKYLFSESDLLALLREVAEDAWKEARKTNGIMLNPKSHSQSIYFEDYWQQLNIE